MPELRLKSDPSVVRNVSQEIANELFAGGEWEFLPGQKIFLTDSNGETFSVDSSQAENYLGQGVYEPQDVGFEATRNIERRAGHERDLDEYVRGTGNRLLGAAEAVGSGLTLGGTDLAFGGKGGRIRREELGGAGTALEIGGALIPALLSGGASGVASGARIGGSRIAGRLLASTPSGLAMRAGEAARIATAGRLAGLANTGALGKATAALGSVAAQGATEGLLYGAGEGVSQVGLSEDPVSAEAAFSTIGGSALHGAALGGPLLGGAAATGKLLKGIQGRVQKRLEKTLDTEATTEIARRLGDAADVEMNALRRDYAAQADREVVDLLEKESSLRTRGRKAEAALPGEKARLRGEVAADEKALKVQFAEERARIKARQTGEFDVFDKVERYHRDVVERRFGAKALEKNPELQELGERFAGRLDAEHNVLNKSWQMLKLQADYLGTPLLPVNQFKKTLNRFNKVFAPKGQVIKDPVKLAKLLAGPKGEANRALMNEAGEQYLRAAQSQSAQPITHSVDDLVANWTITDEFIKASGVRLSQEAQEKFHQQMFAKNMGTIDRDRAQGLADLMQEGRQQMTDLSVREAQAIGGIREGLENRLSKIEQEAAEAVDPKAIDDLTRKIDEIKGQNIDKKLEADLIDRSKKLGALTSTKGLELGMVDKLALANAVGLDFDIIPEGSLLDTVMDIYAGVTLARGVGSAGGFLQAAAKKIPGAGRIAVRALESVGKGALIPRVAGRGARGGGATNVIKTAIADMAMSGARSTARQIKSSEIRFLSTLNKNLDRFIRSGVKLKPGVIPTAVKVLNDVSFFSDAPKRAGARLPLVKAFNARAEELATAVANPQMVTDMVEERLGPVGFQEPGLSEQMVQIALRRIRFLHEKMPKNPGMGAFGQNDKWRPADSEITKWSRYIAGTNPEQVVEDMGNGRLTLEGVEAMEVVTPEIYERSKVRLFETVTERPKDLDYAQRLQLSIFFKSPVDSSMRSEFVSAMQRNFLPQEPPPPASQVNAGRLSPEVAQQQQTPAQRTLA